MSRSWFWLILVLYALNTAAALALAVSVDRVAVAGGWVILAVCWTVMAARHIKVYS